MENSSNSRNNITYLDILSGSISHFTEIPEDFIKQHFSNAAEAKGKKGRLMKMLMEVEFPPKEGAILLDYLKGLELKNTLQYFTNSLNMYQKEIVRQSELN